MSFCVADGMETNIKFKKMIAESLLLFLTSIISLNQPVAAEKKELIHPDKQIEVVQTRTVSVSVGMRGGWDHN